jgi:hypothetical protein
LFQERLARLLAAGNPWVLGPGGGWPTGRGGQDAEVERIEAEQSRMVRVARAARELQRLQPEEVRSWTSAPPFPAQMTYIPMIGEELAGIRGLGNREWMALQDRVLLVVHPDRNPTTTTALWTASPSCPVPHRPRPTGSGGRARAAGLDRAGEGDFLLPWLLHITRYELCERPCCAPFREPNPGSEFQSRLAAGASQ